MSWRGWRTAAPEKRILQSRWSVRWASPLLLFSWKAGSERGFVSVDVEQGFIDFKRVG
jgi:hypothetical protein